MNIQFKSTLILYITFVACLIPLSAFSDEAVIDKPLNVKIDKHIVIQELGERVTTSASENIPSDIVEAVNNNYPDELDKQLVPWLQWYRQNIINSSPENLRKGEMKEGVILHYYALIKEVNLIGNNSAGKQNVEDMIVVYGIGITNYDSWAVSVLRKENNTYKKICETPVNKSGGKDFKIVTRNLKDHKEILISFVNARQETVLFVYNWGNNLVTLVGNFKGVKCKGDIEIDNEEIIEHGGGYVNYYKWDGNKYTMYKTENTEEMNAILIKAIPQDLITQAEKEIENDKHKNPWRRACSITNFTSTIGVWDWVESKLDNNKGTYIIVLYHAKTLCAAKWLDKLIIFKKTGDTLSSVWTSKEEVSGLSVCVKDIFHDDRKEIIVWGTPSNMYTNDEIFRWEGTTARFLGSFDDAFDCRWAAVKGGNKLPSGGIQGDEVIEFLCNESKIYKWDGHDYKLVKVVKAVPGTPLFKDGEWQDLFLGGGVNGAIAKLKSLNNQALHLFNKGKIHKAISIWQQALASPVIDIGLPEDAEVYNNLGFAYYKLGKKYYPLAEKYYKEAKETYQWRWSIYLNLGDLYSDMGQSKLATENYEILLKMKPDYKHADEIKKKIELLRTIN